MSTIKEFNVILNRSDSKRFYLWKNYRDNLTNFILERTTGEIENLLILAAGNCDDLDIALLNSKSRKVFLSDTDTIAMERAVKRINNPFEMPETLSFEYTGLAQNKNWNNLVKTIIKCESDDDIDEMILDFKNAVLKYSFPSVLKHKFDVIVISPVYTQLLFQQFNNSISIINDLEFDRDLLKYAYDSFLNLMPYVIDKFNRNVCDVLSSTGKIFVISDIFEGESNSKFVNKIHSIINKPNLMEEYYRTYQKKFGTGLGDYGLLNMSEYLEPVEHTWMEWPFSDDRIIFIKIVEYCNKSL